MRLRIQTQYGRIEEGIYLLADGSEATSPGTIVVTVDVTDLSAVELRAASRPGGRDLVEIKTMTGVEVVGSEQVL